MVVFVCGGGGGGGGVGGPVFRSGRIGFAVTFALSRSAWCRLPTTSWTANRRQQRARRIRRKQRQDAVVRYGSEVRLGAGEGGGVEGEGGVGELGGGLEGKDGFEAVGAEAGRGGVFGPEFEGGVGGDCGEGLGGEGGVPFYLFWGRGLVTQGGMGGIGGVGCVIDKWDDGNGDGRKRI